MALRAACSGIEIQDYTHNELATDVTQVLAIYQDDRTRGRGGFGHSLGVGGGFAVDIYSRIADWETDGGRGDRHCRFDSGEASITLQPPGTEKRQGRVDPVPALQLDAHEESGTR